MLKILHYGHPLLREKAAEIRRIGADQRDLVRRMAETMYASRGIGLAATQVGVLQRLFVVDVDFDRDDPRAEDTKRLQVFINPEIAWESDDDEPFTEGCLSVPGIEGEIYRPAAIKIVARGLDFEPFEIEADGLLARVCQHEADHLDGTLFVDRLNMIKRTVLAGQLNTLKRETLAELESMPDKYPISD